MPRRKTIWYQRFYIFLVGLTEALRPGFIGIFFKKFSNGEFMGSESRFPASITIFCLVIDYFGDIGVCWRLARQLSEENNDLEVSLVVDDMATFHKICSLVDQNAKIQWVGKVKIISWKYIDDFVALNLPVDVVIEAFGCSLPDTYVKAIAKLPIPPKWIVLEYLSAEPWVEQFHCLPSPHTLLPLVKHFFFPGFTEKTGGLLREKNLYRYRAGFQKSLNRKEFLSNRIGRAFDKYWEHYKNSILISLFCYPHAPVDALLNAISDCEDGRPTICLVPEGVSTNAVSNFLESPAVAGAVRAKGNLLLAVIALTDQDGYDKLLWACDLNFVRGEDSFLRAQWAGRPAVWHIYPQENHAELPKLNAFVERYTDNMNHALRTDVRESYRAWNGLGDICMVRKVLSDLIVGSDQFLSGHHHSSQNWLSHARNWALHLGSHQDLASNLLQYVSKVG